MSNSTQDSDVGFEKAEENIELIKPIKENLSTLQSGQVDETLLTDDLRESSSAIVADDSLTEPAMKYEKGYIEQCIDGLYYIVTPLST